MKKKYLVPFILVAALFFLWGFAHSILDVLNKHFQDALVISKAHSALVQAVLYGGYFLMAIPAGMIIRRRGYRTGMVTGLALYGLGALLFIPGASVMSFPFFLFCLFIIGCGLTCLETSANPYITILGEPDSAARRLNLAQSLNGLGWIVGPMVGGLLILGDDSNIALPYAIIGCIVLILAFIFSRLKLPEITEDAAENAGKAQTSIWKVPAFVYGVIALFFYVAAQTGINSFFINYVIESDPSLSARTAAMLLSFGGMGLFFIGRLLGNRIMKYIRPVKLLAVSASCAALCMILVIMNLGRVSVTALCATYLFESIMFPTIFSTALSGVHGEQTKTASSFLIMSIVGGAIAPVFMGIIGERAMAVGFIVPLVCFAAVLVYAFMVITNFCRDLGTDISSYNKWRRHLKKYYSSDNPENSSAFKGIVFMADGRIKHGGIADRIKGMVSLYTYCKKHDIPFKIYFRNPFNLEDYLLPNEYDWRIDENSLTYNKKQSKAIVIKPSKKNNRKHTDHIMRGLHTKEMQYHLYCNASYDLTTFAQDFHELFRPTVHVMENISRNLSEIGGEYVSISFRFMQLLGDFKDIWGDTLSEPDQEALISECLDAVEYVKSMNPEARKILVTADSMKFLERARSKFPYVYIAPGTVSHTDHQNVSADEPQLKTFVDFLMISKAKKAYLFTSGGMYSNSRFASIASLIGGIGFERLHNIKK